METLPEALEILFEVQRKRNNEKISKKKNKLSNSKNMIFFCFLLFGPLLLSKLLTFTFTIHFERFKVLEEHHLQFYKSFLNLNENITT
jgi:hypothetical protein